MIDIRIDSDVPIYKQIVDGMRLSVASGRLGPGDSVPSVRALALKLRVNPNTVARAYRELESSGLFEARRGRGTLVAGSARKSARHARREIVEVGAGKWIGVARQAGMTDAEILQLVRRALGRGKE